MRFLTLSHKEIRLNIVPERYSLRTREQSRSVGQFTLGRMLQSIYGFKALILEEFPIPEERLVLDFYMPHHGLAFEYQGEQHDQFNKFFHIDRHGFEQARLRDERKRQWCDLNGIALVEVRGLPSLEELKELIQNAREIKDE